jgi:hypothetical protein
MDMLLSAHLSTFDPFKFSGAWYETASLKKGFYGRPIWTWSETVVPLPPARQHINSRNKTVRRKAKIEYEKKLSHESDR